MALENGQGITRGYRLGVFGNVVLICGLGVVVMVGLVLLVRNFSYSHDLRFDLTRDGRYELDPLAKSLLRKVEAPVRVTFVYGFDENIRLRARSAVGNQPRPELLRAYYAPLLAAIAERVHRVAKEWHKASPDVYFDIIAHYVRPAHAEEVAAEL